MKIDLPTAPVNPVRVFFGKDLLLNIPFLKLLATPTSLMTWITALLAILPWVIWIVCVIVILLNVIKWVKSNGNEKEVESAKVGIKRAVVGFISMFVLFAIANLMSFTFTGQTFDRMSVALATCKGDFGEMYVFEYARTANIPLDTAYIRCTNIVLEEDKININDPR